MARKSARPGGHDDDSPVFVIAVAAELAGMHAQTLRQYDRIGLVSPSRTRGGGRRYSARDVALLREVQRLSQEEGISLAGIQRILELEKQVNALRARVRDLADEVEGLRGSAAPGSRVFAVGPAGEIITLRAGQRPRPNLRPEALRITCRTAPAVATLALVPTSPLPSDLAIARAAHLEPIAAVAEAAGIPQERLEPYGRHVAKIDLAAVADLAGRPRARYVVITAITPTPLGEGKTTTAVGLAQGLSLLGHRATLALRQPSMGPTFGIKGGAAGAGYSQVLPMETLNLHLTGDFHAVTAAHNLLAAMVDNHIYQGNA